MECLRAPDAYVGFVLRDERNPSAVSLGGVLASLRGETGGDRLSSSEPFVWIRRRQGDKEGGEGRRADVWIYTSTRSGRFWQL